MLEGFGDAPSIAGEATLGRTFEELLFLPDEAGARVGLLFLPDGDLDEAGASFGLEPGLLALDFGGDTSTERKHGRDIAKPTSRTPSTSFKGCFKEDA